MSAIGSSPGGGRSSPSTDWEPIILNKNLGARCAELDEYFDSDTPNLFKLLCLCHKPGGLCFGICDCCLQFDDTGPLAHQVSEEESRKGPSKLNMREQFYSA